MLNIRFEGKKAGSAEGDDVSLAKAEDVTQVLRADVIVQGGGGGSGDSKKGPAEP